MKIVTVSHNAMSRTAGQPRMHALADLPDVDLTVLVPDRMNFYGRWETADPIADPKFRYVIGRARWQRIAGQWYLQHYPSALGRVLRETQPDIVDIWAEPWSLVAAQGVWLTRRICPHARLVVETDQNLFKNLPPPFAWFQRYVLERVDFVATRNSEAIGVLRQKGYSGPARRVPYGVDCGLFRPLPEMERQAVREEMGWGGTGTFVVGYVGRLVVEKGLGDALDALTRLPADVVFVLIGAGDARDGLEARAKALGLQARVYFLNSQPPETIARLMNAFDALILPSRTQANWKEQFGRVLVEAGACGVAVVGSDSGAIPEVVGTGGLTFPEGDSTALAACLQTLRDDPTQRAALGANGCAQARARYDWREVAAQMHAVYREMLTAS